MATLADFYKSQGQSLPSLQQRQPLAQQAGIQNYTGTAQQNTQLLNFLQNQPKTTTPTVPSVTPKPTTPSNVPLATLNTPPVQIPTLNVSTYKDLPGGITENTLSDGSKSYVKYTRNQDGSLTPTEVPASEVSQAARILKEMQVEDTQAQKTAQQLSSSIFDVLPQLMGEKQALAEEQTKAGLPQLRQTLQDLNNQVIKKQAEIAQDDVTLVAQMRAEERRDTLLPFARSGQAKLQGDAQIARALKMSEIGVLNAQALAAQGNIALAQETAQQAVDLKFAPYKEFISIAQAQLLALEPILSRDEKKQATAQQLKMNLALKRIDKEAAEEKAVQDLSFTAIQMGAPTALAMKASKAKTKLEAAQILGPYVKDLDIELKKAQIAKTWADARKNDTVSGVLTDADIKRIDTSPQGKKLVSLSGLYQKAQTYKNLVNEYGFKAAGNAKALLDSAYADLKIAYKEAANLGALTGPDVSIIEEAIKPTSGGAGKYLSYRLSGGQGGVSGAIEQSLSKARLEAVNNYKQLVTRNPKYSGSEYARSLITPFAKSYNTVNIDSVPAGEIIETDDGILLESLGNGQFTPL